MAQVKFEGVAPLSQLHKPTPYRPERNGFDGGATPVWQMVPVSDARFVRITTLGAKIWTAESDQSKIAFVAPESGASARKDVYRIDGKQEGKASLIVRDPTSKELGRLDVLVMRKRTMAVQFFLVSDNAKHATRTKENDAKDMVDQANDKIFSRQMNLTFALSSVKPVTIGQNLGDPIDFGNVEDITPGVPRKTDAEKRWHAITDKGDTNPKIFNVFCVWDYKSDGTDTNGFVESKKLITAAQMEKTGANYNMCMMKDVAEDDRGNIPYLIFGHEAGHYLEGKPFHYPDQSDSDLLMRGDGHIGARLAKRDVESMTKHW